MTVSLRKMSYDIGYGPYFTQITVKELMEGPSHFMQHFDEALTATVQKQMDLLVQYWSEECKEARVKYLTSVMFDHAKAQVVM